jgi:rhodanese-related sulfurtransferase
LEHIKGSISLPLTQLTDTAPSLHFTTALATICPSGFRSATAASILMRSDIRDIVVPLEGFKGWKNLNLPTEK